MKNFFKYIASAVFFFSVLFFFGLSYAQNCMPSVYDINDLKNSDINLFPFNIINARTRRQTK